MSLLLLLEVILAGVASGQKNIITLKDGGYSNLLIAIDPQVEENPTIIDNLKTMFTSASQRLYQASKKHVYWEHIKILVPNTWSIQSQYQSARTETLQSANIIVHEFEDDEPFVDNVAGCGKEGSLMHMTPKYIIDEEYREDKFGNTDRVLVRSWGYYRWGLFKEHYDGKGGGAPAYDSPYSGTEGTRCSLKIKGNLEMPGGSPCQRSPNNANSGYHPDCRFVPETQGQTATASLLFAPRGAHIHSVEDFCEEDSHPDSVHNPLAANLMNINCGGDSAWKVMLDRTTDFRNGTSLISNTTPNFEVLQVSLVRSVVLVLDISGSMAGNRFDRMIQSSIHYIMNIIPENSKLGIVSFSTGSSVRASLTDITDTSSREGLVNDLPSGTTGTTCIGCGILKGIEVLGSYAEGGYLLLLSDGGENVYPYIEDTYDEIEEAGVIIDTITISNAADPKMEDLSTRTSGLSSFCSDTGTGTCLQQAFQRTVTERPDISMETVPAQVG
ncbi:calcium-activated chloride channel regulator family member 3-like [Lytechinus variegatus]|uniref:calcium-activated chloride channel regulator family member 3-like n=1 Tax=Lytechinus variegatus TaxID=7654 RepID=UPI001BB11F00|nr:calcium-activated chloride channel regulator family member 3-like [Lytechinus variegatus]